MRETKYQGKYLSITEEVIDGHTYERVEMLGGVKVFPMYDNKILVIKEYRVHEGVSRWKFIGGWLDKKNKTPLETAQEEMEEEVGLHAENWHELYSFHSKGRTAEYEMHFFVACDAQVLENPRSNPDNDIIESTRWVTQDELWTMIDNREIDWDQGVFMAIQALRLYGNETK